MFNYHYRRQSAMARTAVTITVLLVLQICTRIDAASPVEDWAASVDVPVETPQASADRHQRVAQRRSQIQIICHRGAWEFAHENTLEA